MWCFRPRVFDVTPLVPAKSLAVVAAERRPILLDTAGDERRRFSLLGFDPLQGSNLDPTRGIAGARELLDQLERGPGHLVPGPFQGGFLGAFAYDLGVAGEARIDVAAEPWRFPLAIGGLYVDFLVRDEWEGGSWLVLGEEPGDARPPVDQRLREFERAADLARESERRSTAARLTRWTPPAEHARRIEVARAQIANGAYYQVNLAHRFTCGFDGDPRDLYRALRRANPAPYMGFAAWPTPAGGAALLSASPELLLEVEGRTARTRPIKGTAARASDPGLDQRRGAALLSSEKDKAELAMIVDLERNDLGRVALPGSVRVEGFPTLRSYTRVHHLTADVVAELRPDAHALDALSALFPGGSVTGAPKLAAMRAIAELEGEGRGYFCGSLGFADTRGNAEFNVLIRTLSWRPGEVSFRVGGGITWSSNAAAEERETLDKASGILDALGV